MTRELQWLEQRVEEEGSTIAEVTQAEHQRQAAMNVTVRNIITSMRQISAIDWTELVERVSLVDGLLRENGNFAEMDFGTRDHYRKAIEKLSRGSHLPELEVTRRAIAAAETSRSDGPDERERDPGYHLFGDGHRAFERTLGYRPPPSDWPRRAAEAGGSGIYIGGILLVAVLIVAAWWRRSCRSHSARPLPSSRSLPLSRPSTSRPRSPIALPARCSRRCPCPRSSFAAACRASSARSSSSRRS